MSMVVSYKKQVVLGILLLIILLGAVEVIVNIYLYNFYKCEFEENELFKDTKKETLRIICLENIGLASADDSIGLIEGTYHANTINENIVYINSEGFRSPEFTKEKPENTVRIFTLGGSTTFGSGVLDHQTYPSLLQKFFDNSNLDFKVEIINAGWPSQFSGVETILIKERLLDFAPDLFLVYDGWNELNQQYRKNNPDASPKLWFERWKEICIQGKTYGYDTIIAIQPLAATKKILSTQEEQMNSRWLENNKAGKSFIHSYPIYLEKLNELKNHCSLTADMTGIFNHIEGPIYFDSGHTGFQGNKIIAQEFYDLIFPIVMETTKHTNSNEITNNPKNPFENIPSEGYSDVFKETNNFFKKLISPYNTPKVLSLIFE